MKGTSFRYYIEIEELRKVLKQMRNGASVGPDLLLNELIKHDSDTLITYILQLFNKGFDLGYFSEAWSEGYIIPIHNQRTSGPVNAHLTPLPGIYFNAFMYIAPGQGQTTPWDKC